MDHKRPSGWPPQAQIMGMVTTAWAAQTVAAVTRLGVPDVLQEHGPLSARALCTDHGIDAKPEPLHRALRACASLDVFTEDAEGRFGSTPLSEVLTLGSAGSVKRFVENIGGPWWKTFAGLPEALATGESQQEAQLGTKPWAAQSEQQIEEFGEAMESRKDSTLGVLAHVDLSKTRRLIDVGGGFGHLAIALLGRYPQLEATVFDLPEVIRVSERRAAVLDPALRARLSFVGGDMFEELPPGDTYLAKAILHDWDDAHAQRVLERMREQAVEGGRILCVDNVLPPIGDTSCRGTKLLDMLMLVSMGGKERTEAEWRALYAQAGLVLGSITQMNPVTGEGVIEGARVG